MEIPLKANVECSDGVYGRSVCVLINPLTEQVTHLVVQETSAPHTQYVVPLDGVATVIAGTIQLHYNRAELEKMVPFVQTEYITDRQPKTDDVYERTFDMAQYYHVPFVVPAQITYVPVQHLEIPPGELAVRRGTRVEATDGPVGRVDEFVVNAKNGAITHLVMREGHPWAPRDVIIPVSDLGETRKEVVYLKLDRRQVEALPSFPLHRHWA